MKTNQNKSVGFMPFAGIYLNGIFLHGRNGAIRKFTSTGSAEAVKRHLDSRGIVCAVKRNNSSAVLEVVEVKNVFDIDDYEKAKSNWLNRSTHAGAGTAFNFAETGFAFLADEATLKLFETANR